MLKLNSRGQFARLPRPLPKIQKNLRWFEAIVGKLLIFLDSEVLLIRDAEVHSHLLTCLILESRVGLAVDDHQKNPSRSIEEN